MNLLNFYSRFKEAYAQRGLCYNTLGNYNQALADLNTAINIGYSEIWVYANRSVTHTNLGNYNEAIADFSITIGLDPNSGLPYASRGNCYNLLGNYDEALADLNKAISLGYTEDWVYKERDYAFSNLISSIIPNIGSSATPTHIKIEGSGFEPTPKISLLWWRTIYNWLL